MAMEKKVWSSSEVERLITLYHDRSCLWDIRSMEYKDRIKKEAAFKEISTEMNTEEVEITRKLHNLRSQFSTEKRKRDQSKSGSEGGRIIRKWEHYESLQFISDAVDSRKSKSNLSVSLNLFNLFLI